MTEQHVEKSFLYLLLLSLLLHLAVFAIAVFLPEKRQTPPAEPVFIDLQDMPELKIPPQEAPSEKPRPSDKTRRVTKESSPAEKPLSSAARREQSQPGSVARSSAKPGESGQQQIMDGAAGSSVKELLRRKPQGESVTAGDRPGLKPGFMPSASKMAQIEESYRRRFADDLEDGTTRFLNTDDVQFGSFLRRFETAVYGVWRYPQEAAMQGVEGVTPVRITFNRKGEIVNVKLLESSGSRILDDEVFRTLRLLGPMGNLPKTYNRDQFHLIAFFQYGNARGRLR